MVTVEVGVEGDGSHLVDDLEFSDEHVDARLGGELACGLHDAEACRLRARTACARKNPS